MPACVIDVGTGYGVRREAAEQHMRPLTRPFLFLAAIPSLATPETANRNTSFHHVGLFFSLASFGGFGFYFGVPINTTGFVLGAN